VSSGQANEDDRALHSRYLPKGLDHQISRRQAIHLVMLVRYPISEASTPHSSLHCRPKGTGGCGTKFSGLPCKSEPFHLQQAL
jgi:hypothetical protein